MAKKVKLRGGGVEGAAKLLSSLDPQHAERLLQQIKKLDSSVGEVLSEQMVAFEDLQYLSVSMLQDLLKEITLSQLGLALRLGTPKLRQHLLGFLSSGMRREVEEVLLGPPRSASDVQAACAQIMAVVRRKVESGQIVLDPDEKYV